MTDAGDFEACPDSLLREQTTSGSHDVHCYGIIPARYASSRFPGKPLADIHGHPMFWHVWYRAMRSAALEKVILATDDERIREAADALGVPCVMTRPDHASGTDRVYEAAIQVGIPADAVVINIQGDEPALDPLMLDELVAPFLSEAETTTARAVQVVTLATPIPAERAASPNQVKVVITSHGDALYFSRAPVPFSRDVSWKESDTPYLGHIGLYAFRMSALERFVTLPPSNLEQREKLEQLRLLENGIPIRVVCTTRQSRGVDTEEDLKAVRVLLAP